MGLNDHAMVVRSNLLMAVLLCPWEWHFTIISAWRFQTISKFAPRVEHWRPKAGLDNHSTLSTAAVILRG